MSAAASRPAARPALTVADALALGPLPASERAILLRHASGLSRAALIAHPEQALDAEAEARYRNWTARRAAGEPVAYLLGRREFYGLDFEVGPAVLIPRPETELLVDLALEWLADRPGARVLDLGTGSGAIAIAIAALRPDLAVTAVEASPDALALARRNGERLLQAGGRPRFLGGDWYGPVAGDRFDLIVSNPPYVAAGDPHLDQGDLRFEPPAALVAGPDGLADLRRVIAGAPGHLVGGGALMVEHGHDQGPAVLDLMAGAGLDSTATAHDLAGLPRVGRGFLTPSRGRASIKI